MPGQVYPAFISLLISVFAGTGVAPVNVFMGLASNGQEVGVNDGATPPVLSGYARKTIAVSSIVANGNTLIIPTQIWTFSATPSQPNADTWFIAGKATESNYYLSGPLNPAVVVGVLPLGATRGSGAITVTTPVAVLLTVGDRLRIGTDCNKNIEYPFVTAIGSDVSGNTILSVTSVSYPHPVGEAITRDGSTRSYVAGWVETVDASAVFTSG